MAELEVHREIEVGHDPTGQKVGILAAVLAVFLAVVTILSHRTHTEAILLKAAANDAWQHYQSTRVKFHGLELSQDLIGSLMANAPAASKLAKYGQDARKYEDLGHEIQQEAQRKESEANRAEDRALRYDLGEGMLEIALVLTSLYFISRKTLFPAIGIVAGAAGIVVAAAGLLV